MTWKWDEIIRLSAWCFLTHSCISIQQALLKHWYDGGSVLGPAWARMYSEKCGRPTSRISSLWVLVRNSTYTHPESEAAFCQDPQVIHLLSKVWEVLHEQWVQPRLFIQITCSVQFSSVAQSCPTLCDPMDCSTPGLPVHHQLLEVTQTHVHWVGDAIQPSHPLLSPSPPIFNLSQHQGTASYFVNLLFSLC